MTISIDVGLRSKAVDVDAKAAARTRFMIAYKEGASVAVKDTIHNLECISAMNKESLH
jgi:hypothetical protein